MEQHDVRVRCLGVDEREWAAAIAAVLRAGGASAPREAGARPVTWLLFEKVTDDVLQAVATTSRRGLERVIATATQRRPLDVDAARALLRAGASDAFAWHELPDPVEHVWGRVARWRRIDDLLASSAVRAQLVGESPAWVACLRQVIELAVFSDGPVLLLGESGTGKELLSRLLHTLDSRADKGELVVLDCTTVVPELSGSEFFGHERGAFTGAVTARDGAFALADGGTLFLDEVGELPLTLQAQLLRVVQEHTYKRVGSNAWQRTRFRLVCATHRDLRQDVLAGRFRNDFYHRIASRIVHLPPLRARRDDILPLAQSFASDARDDGRVHVNVRFDAAVARFLTGRDYPGNVRELRQLVERIKDRHEGSGLITLGDVPADEWDVHDSSDAPATPGPVIPEGFDEVVGRALAHGYTLKDIGRQATEAAVRLALADENGNLQRAAKRLGVTDRALQLRRAQRSDEAQPGLDDLATGGQGGPSGTA